jgi:hypothetical protein
VCQVGLAPPCSTDLAPPSGLRVVSSHRVDSVGRFAVREPDGRESIEFLAAAKAREQRAKRRAASAPTEEELEAIARAEAALHLVVRDIEATTSFRQPSRAQRYVEWMAETPPDRLSESIAGRRHDDVDTDGEEEGIVLACHWGGHSFALSGDQPDLVLDIARHLQDDVIHEVWGAWPPCPRHEHPMALDVVDGVTVWACRRDDDLVVPVGQLQATPSWLKRR